MIVSIENSFVLASIRSLEKVQESEARPKNWLVSICFDNKSGWPFFVFDGLLSKLSMSSNEFYTNRLPEKFSSQRY